MDLKTLFGIEPTKKQTSPSTVLTRAVAAILPQKTQGARILPFPTTQITPVQATVVQPIQPTMTTNSTSSAGPAPSLSTSAGGQVIPIGPTANSEEMLASPDSAVPVQPAVSVSAVPSSTDQVTESTFVPMASEEVAPISLAAKILTWFQANKRKLMWGAVAVAGVVVSVKVWKKIRK